MFAAELELGLLISSAGIPEPEGSGKSRNELVHRATMLTDTLPAGVAAAEEGGSDERLQLRDQLPALSTGSREPLAEQFVQTNRADSH
jgi:hypothetical protein